MQPSAPANVVTVGDITRDAAWCVRKVDVLGQAHIVRVDKAAYDASAFLDNRMAVRPGCPSGTLPFAALDSAFRHAGQQDTRYIFHISHVGSTLISRMLGLDPGVLSLREPELLRWLASIRLKLDTPESFYGPADYAGMLRTTLGLLARPLEGADKVVVKASSYASLLASEILQNQPNASAVAVHCKLDVFLATILKGRGGWRDTLNNAPQRVRRLNAAAPAAGWALVGMSPGEITAMSWFSEMVTLAHARELHGDRIQWLDFDAFLEDVDQQMAVLCAHFRLPWSAVDAERLGRSAVMGRYSKNSAVEFTPAMRQKLLAETQALQAEEMTRGRAWVADAVKKHRLGPVVAEFI
jgi:hypothetical protein